MAFAAATLAISGAGSANASIISYISSPLTNVALQSTAVAVGGKQATLLPVVHGIDTITLPTFDNHGGTYVLQGVTIYFYASVNVTTADGSNVVLTAKSGNKAVSIDVDPVSGFTNGAAALNTFPSEPLQLAAPQTVAANAHVSYPTPFSAAANAGANPVIDVNGATIASGTGSGPIMFTSPVQTHLRGAVLNISNPGSGYIDGTGTFTLTGFKPREFFEIKAPAERDVPRVSFGTSAS